MILASRLDKICQINKLNKGTQAQSIHIVDSRCGKHICLLEVANPARARSEPEARSGSGLRCDLYCLSSQEYRRIGVGVLARHWNS